MFFRVVCDQSTLVDFSRDIVSRIWFRKNQKLPRFARIDREHRKHLVSPPAVISAPNLSCSITGRGKMVFRGKATICYRDYPTRLLELRSLQCVWKILGVREDYIGFGRDCVHNKSGWAVFHLNRDPNKVIARMYRHRVVVRVLRV